MGDLRTLYSLKLSYKSKEFLAKRKCSNYLVVGGVDHNISVLSHNKKDSYCRNYSIL